MLKVAEVWLPVVGYELFYDISNWGTVRSKFDFHHYKAGRLRSGHPAPNGYYRIALKGKWFSIHSLVAEAFIGPRPKDHQVNHKDGNKTNNRFDNLEYVTPAENQQHAARLGLSPTGKRCGAYTKPESLPRGESQYLAKLSNDMVREIRAIPDEEWHGPTWAEKLGVQRSTLNRARAGKSWKHI